VDECPVQRTTELARPLPPIALLALLLLAAQGQGQGFAQKPDSSRTFLPKEPVMNYPNKISWIFSKNGKSSQAPSAGASVCSSPFVLDPRMLYRHQSTITVVGRIEDLDLQWARRIRGTICLSIGDVPLAANADTLPLELQNGTWVLAKLEIRGSGSDMFGLAEPTTRVLRVEALQPDRLAPTSWTPTVRFHRLAHMRRLRRLLSELEPGLQAIFMVALADEQNQHRFFYRVAALDHHIYQGGLFDCSVEAAELAFQQDQLSVRERGIAALVCLLFDFGKVTDDVFRADRLRCHGMVAPHPRTLELLEPALSAVQRFEPELVEAVENLLAPTDSKGSALQTGRTSKLQQVVHQALQQAWQSEQSISDDFTTGEQA
jgi:hypothetical protein